MVAIGFDNPSLDGRLHAPRSAPLGRLHCWWSGPAISAGVLRVLATSKPTAACIAGTEAAGHGLAVASDWQGDGSSPGLKPQLAAQIKQLKLPVVDLFEHEGSDDPGQITDNGPSPGWPPNT